MLQRVAGWMAHHLSGAAPDKDEEAIRYGLQSFLSEFMSLAVLGLLASLFGNLLETVLFLAAFIFLRRYVGGYHANSYFRCFLTTVCCYLANAGLVGLLSGSLMYPAAVVAAALSLGLIFWFAPHENPRHPMTAREREVYGRISRYGAVVVFVLAAGLFAVGWERPAFYVCMAVFSTAVSLLIAVLLQRRKTWIQKGGRA